MDVVRTEKIVRLVTNVTSTQPIVTPYVAERVSYNSLPYIHPIGPTCLATVKTVVKYLRLACATDYSKLDVNV